MANIDNYGQWGKNSEKVLEFVKRRNQVFDDFHNRSNPENLVGDERIVPRGASADEIKNIFNRILTLDFFNLKEKLQTGEHNAYTVLCAFVWRALSVDSKINCITELIANAFDEAERLDEAAKSDPKGPLFGLPFSVKSNFFVEGYDVTVGLAKLLEQKKETTCPMVKFLSNKGAIPFCLTNVPQGLLSYVSSNPLYGTTRNPFDFSRTPGGSSGGEAALLAAGGSAFGIGSDLAGSLRIPAAFCGLVTLKPTQDRLYVTDTHGGLPGRGRLGLSFGFYTRTVEENHFLLHQIVGHPEYLDLCPMSSASPIDSSRLKSEKPVIGYFTEDGFNPVVPSNHRAVMDTIRKLQRQGYSTVELNITDVDESLIDNKHTNIPSYKVANMLFRNVMPDNGAYMAEMYSGEPYDKYMSRFISLVCLKQYFGISFLTRMAMKVDKLAKTLCNSDRFVCLGKASNASLAECRQNQENTDNYKLRWIKYWKSKKIDAIICPSFITPAQPFEYPSELSTGVFITGLWNMLDMPAGIVPVSPVNEEDMTELNAFRTNGDELLDKQKSAASDSMGLPNAVQIVTLPNCEEMCLRVMKTVQDVTDGVQVLRWNPPSDYVATTKGAIDDDTKSEDFFSRSDLTRNRQVPPLESIRGRSQ